MGATEWISTRFSAGLLVERVGKVADQGKLWTRPELQQSETYDTSKAEYSSNKLRVSCCNGVRICSSSLFSTVAWEPRKSVPLPSIGASDTPFRLSVVDDASLSSRDESNPLKQRVALEDSEDGDDINEGGNTDDRAGKPSVLDGLSELFTSYLAPCADSEDSTGSVDYRADGLKRAFGQDL